MLLLPLLSLLLSLSLSLLSHVKVKSTPSPRPNWSSTSLLTAYLHTGILDYLITWLLAFLLICILANLQSCILACFLTCIPTYMHTYMHTYIVPSQTQVLVFLYYSTFLVVWLWLLPPAILKKLSLLKMWTKPGKFQYAVENWVNLAHFNANIPLPVQIYKYQVQIYKNKQEKHSFLIHPHISILFIAFYVFNGKGNICLYQINSICEQNVWYIWKLNILIYVDSQCSISLQNTQTKMLHLL